MNKLNIKNLDLNLLIVFTTLWDIRNVTRASERLSLTQPAVSHALRRLRERLGDPLFINGRDGLLPTPRATELIGPVREALEKIDQALQGGPSFVPAVAQREFRIAAGDFVEFALLPKLTERIATTAPGIVLKVVHFPAITNLPALLEQGAIDLAIGALPQLAVNLCSEPLVDLHFCTLIWKRERLASKRFPLALYLERQHVVLDSQTYGGNIVDQTLAAHGYRRRIGAQVQSMLTMPAIAARTGFCCTVPRQIGTTFAEVFGLSRHEPPIELPVRPLIAYWHTRFDADPGLLWLREQVRLSAMAWSE